MKHRFFPVILSGVGLMMTLGVTAKDVYVYSPAGEKIGSAGEVKRIVFDNGKMTLVPETGEDVNIELSDLGCFSFSPLDFSGISDVEDTGITVKMNGDILSVTSTAEISEIRIYNIFGIMTGHSTPAACEATMSIGTSGVYIVAVTAGGITQTYKISR